ncbi:MAG: GAF domain-containing protein [Candidatus Omnitrophica bacterium]|nr:GAF domain-containing protein [Candidatus Omnitrophota bacterium]
MKKDIMQHIAQQDNKSNSLKSALTNCMSLLESKSGSIFLFDTRRQELILKTASNSRKRCLRGVRQRLGEGISGLVASKRKSLLVKDISRDSRLRNRRRFNHYRTNSFLSVPLLAAGKLIGVININEKASGTAFTAKDLQLLSSISNYIANAIEQTRIYEESEKSKRQLNKFASVGKLVSGMAHELNNPLDGVIRYINLSLVGMGEDGLVREYLLNAKQGLNRIVSIIRSLLDFAQSSSPAFNRPIDINKAIEDSLLMMSHHIRSNNIKVLKQSNQQLPLVRDSGLKLVFTNIIKNACDAMPEKGTLKISTGMSNGYLEINFSNTGPGIPEEIQDRIFEPFFTTKQMGKGSGLGLAICYSIIQRHNGKIFLQQAKEKGASFTIQLPLNGLDQARGQ